MGAVNAQGFADAVDEGLVGQRAALHYHLTANHFPSVHPVFIDTAIEAIDHANAGDWDTEITMPNDITLTVASIVEQLHLGFFLDQDGE